MVKEFLLNYHESLFQMILPTGECLDLRSVASPLVKYPPNRDKM